ncbi:MAG: hypothetical protein AB1779_04335 [Candidatus Thermoplasmatota archaeon]
MHDDDVNKKYDFEREKQRFLRLKDAYELQEKEINLQNEKIAALEQAIADKEKVIKSLKEVLENRDKEYRELEIELNKLRAESSAFEPKLNELQQSLKLEREKFAKLFTLAEELDTELKQLRREVEVRDEWFKNYLSIFGETQKAIEERERMIREVKREERSIA